MTLVHDLLVLVLPGALFIFTANLTRLYLRRVQGYAFLFYTLLAGWVIQSSVAAINGLALIAFDLADIDPIQVTPPVYARALVSSGLFFAIATSFLLNLHFDIDRVSRLLASVTGNFLDWQLQLAIERQQTLEITLQSGKSYIGIPYASRITAPDEGDVGLVPILSGYRDPRQKLRITSNYATVLDADTHAERSLTMADQTITIRKREIVSARPFDIRLYIEFFEGFVPGLPSPNDSAAPTKNQ